MKRAPFVDMVFGPQTLHKLPQMYDEVQKNHSSSVDVSFPEMENDLILIPKVEDMVVVILSITPGPSSTPVMVSSATKLEFAAATHSAFIVRYP